MIRFLPLVIAYLVAFYCTPVISTVKERQNKKDFEGFVNEDTFQVICTSPTSSDESFRSRFIKECREHACTTLAKYKIAYDYNLTNLKSVSPTNMIPLTIDQREKVIKEKNLQSYDTSKSSGFISNPGQLDVKWSPEQLKKLKEVYSEFFPGSITREWEENNTVSVIYTISRPNLMTKIKDKALPFGIEFSN